MPQGLVPKVRVIGPGRAGCSLARALDVRGWEVVEVLGRHDDSAGAAADVDVLVIATPDAAIGPTAATVEPSPTTVVTHLAGSLGTDVLAPHPRRGVLHPLVPLPDAGTGSRRLLAGATFAVSGDRVVRRMAEALGGAVVEVDDAHRAAYHAAACIAANHVVALLGQVERVAATAGLDLQTFLGLTRAAVDDVERLGVTGALTGPAARSDWDTLQRHTEALAPEELAAYRAGVTLARRLVAGAATAGAAEASSAGARQVPVSPTGRDRLAPRRPRARLAS